jgi:hypothetical protein
MDTAVSLALFTVALVACIMGLRAQHASTLVYGPDGDRDGGAGAMSRTFAIDDLQMSHVLPVGSVAQLRVGHASSLTAPGGAVDVHSTGGHYVTLCPDIFLVFLIAHCRVSHIAQ